MSVMSNSNDQLIANLEKQLASERADFQRKLASERAKLASERAERADSQRKLADSQTVIKKLEEKLRSREKGDILFCSS